MDSKDVDTSDKLKDSQNVLQKNILGKSILINKEKKELQRDVTSSTFQKDMLHGPVYTLITVHYTWYSIVLLILSLLQPYPGTIPMLILYAGSCVIVHELCRLHSSSTAPIYATFIPYVVFHIASREAHLVTALFWFSSLMTINMQTASLSLKWDIPVLSFIFICTYCVCSFILSSFVSFHYSSLFNGVKRDDILGKEISFCVCISLLAVSVYMLYSFITAYAAHFAQQEKDAKHLKNILIELQNELKEFKVDIVFDSDAPITKVISVLKNIQESSGTQEVLVECLEDVIAILTSNHIYQPNLQQTADSDINNWLNNMLNYTRPIQKASIEPSQTSHGFEILFHAPQANQTSANDFFAENFDAWDFDLFHYTTVNKGKPLQKLLCKICDRYNLGRLFNIDSATLSKFAQTVESSYNNHPYHSSVHAADVLQAVHFFIHVMDLGEFLSSEERLAALLAAACHDVDHPGLNNAFLVKTYSPLTLRYNDKSVLENYHCSKTFEIISSEGCDILSLMTQDKRKVIRSLIIQMIMATDMAFHFELITKFKNKVAGGGFEFNEPKDRSLILSLAIKCADVSNPCRKPELSKIWSKLIMEEFWNQGDQERALGIPVSMFMDRNNSNVAKCQLGFIDFIVKPLYDPWEAFLNRPHLFPASQNLSINREYWKKQLESTAEN